ncbi:hypothetical protein [Bacillus wiedmannii]|uniref:hypothetical protein n=1 Tax=Bacillus wiedmannii TaxID=1890302 RepID=UPI00211DA140|nr:hypothetical protein [Bacillus wiedmannii]
MVEEYKHELEFIPYSYEQIEEIERIVNEYTPHVHAWFFSSPLPYEIAKKYIGTDKIMVYVPATESGLYKSLLEMIYEQGRMIEKLSIDTMSLNNISEEALSQLHIKKPQIYTKVFDLDIEHFL